MYRISVSNEEIEKLPLAAFPGRIVIIDKPGIKLNITPLSNHFCIIHLPEYKVPDGVSTKEDYFQA